LDGHHVASNCDWPYVEFKLPIEFYLDFEIKIYRFDPNYGLKLIFTHRYNDYDQVVRFIVDTEDYNEANFWVSKIKEYQRKNYCKIQILSHFQDIDSGLVDFLKIQQIGKLLTLEKRVFFGLVIGKLFGHINTRSCGKIFLQKKLLMIFWDCNIILLFLLQINLYGHRKRIHILLHKTFR
jgi:hypothetical protein